MEGFPLLDDSEMKNHAINFGTGVVSVVEADFDLSSAVSREGWDIVCYRVNKEKQTNLLMSKGFQTVIRMVATNTNTQQTHRYIGSYGPCSNSFKLCCLSETMRRKVNMRRRGLPSDDFLVQAVLEHILAEESHTEGI